ncbi:hypothetical protein SAMN02787118_119142 [Streptomyces mirabilis]|uniref:Uncharacterized protein n=1 Tax=Streptomyces mirabilis TaxID=68239 RepID=A0A1I2REM4_9ACTN|nr:hypothetical protein SAMN02787118_119142 [Streptomyces mirabilis]
MPEGAHGDAEALRGPTTPFGGRHLDRRARGGGAVPRRLPGIPRNRVTDRPPTSLSSYVTTDQETRPHAAGRPVRWAADTVATMREGARLRLDYSASSLWRVDRMIDGLRREDTPYAAVESVLRGFGAYAGEVIVRQTGAEWWQADGHHWIRTAEGRRGIPSTRPAAASPDTAHCGCCAATRRRAHPNPGIGGRGEVRDPRRTARHRPDTCVGRPEPRAVGGVPAAPSLSVPLTGGVKSGTERGPGGAAPASGWRAPSACAVPNPALTQRMAGAKRHPTGTVPVAPRLTHTASTGRRGAVRRPWTPRRGHVSPARRGSQELPAPALASSAAGWRAPATT